MIQRPSQTLVALLDQATAVVGVGGAVLHLIEGLLLLGLRRVNALASQSTRSWPCWICVSAEPESVVIGFLLCSGGQRAYCREQPRLRRRLKSEEEVGTCTVSG